MEPESIKRIYFRQSLRPKRPKNNFESQNIWTHPSNNQTRIWKKKWFFGLSFESFLFNFRAHPIYYYFVGRRRIRQTAHALVCRHSRKKSFWRAFSLAKGGWSVRQRLLQFLFIFGDFFKRNWNELILKIDAKLFRADSFVFS